jgi:ActR/RegA family two-component response regulator/Holliday junction resolvase-like predicted endonuclease
VVDDEANFLKTIVTSLQLKEINAEGLQPGAFLRRTNPNEFDYDMIFLDMHLGTAADGTALTARDLLVHLITYSPSAKAVVFTQQDITVAECTGCIKLGALGFVPKSSKVEDFVLIANVYAAMGDTEQVRQEVIRRLRTKMDDPGVSAQARGRLLENLMVNLFNTVAGFAVVDQHQSVAAGEIDLVVRNHGQDDFWRRLQSYYLVVECKSGADAVEKREFNHFAAKVRARGCRVGIMVSMAGVTRGFDDLRHSHDEETIFSLERTNIDELIRCQAPDREARLRQLLQNQMS